MFKKKVQYLIVVFSMVVCHGYSQKLLIFYDNDAKSSIDNILLKSEKNNHFQIVSTGDSVKTGELGKRVKVIHLSYKDTIADLRNFENGDTLFLSTKNNYFQEVAIGAKKLNLFEKVSYALNRANRKKKEKHSITLFKSLVDQKLVEAGKIESIDEVLAGNYSIKYRNAIEYKFSTESVFFNLDIDRYVRNVLSTDYSVKHLLNLKKKLKKKDIRFTIVNCSFNDKEEEVCTIEYFLKTYETAGAFTLNMISNEILTHDFTIYKNPNTQSLNKDIPCTFDSLTIASKLNSQNEVEYVSFSAYYRIFPRDRESSITVTNGYIYYYENLEKLDKFKITVPYCNNVSIAEDLQFTVTKSIGILPNKEFINNTGSLINNDSIVNELIDYFDYGSSIIVWSEIPGLHLNSVDIFLDRLELPEGAFWSDYIDIQTFWSFEVDLHKQTIISNPSIWRRKGASFIGNGNIESLILLNLIFDNMELRRRKAIKSIQVLMETMEQPVAIETIRNHLNKYYLESMKSCTELISKTRFGENRDELKFFYDTISKELEVDRNILDIVLAHEKNQNHSYADWLLSAGLVDQSLELYIEQLNKKKNLKELANLYYNISFAFAKKDDFPSAKKYYNLAIELIPDIDSNRRLERLLNIK